MLKMNQLPDKPVETATASDTATDPPASTEPAPVTASAPVERPVSAPSVFIAIPPGTNDGFRIRDRLRAAGFKAVLSEIPVQYKSVWRFVTADPATFAPPQVIVKAVFLPGFEKDAAKICGVAICTEPAPREVSPLNRKIFEDAFAGGSVALLVYPKVVRREPPSPTAVLPEHPTAQPKE